LSGDDIGLAVLQAVDDRVRGRIIENATALRHGRQAARIPGSSRRAGNRLEVEQALEPEPSNPRTFEPSNPRTFEPSNLRTFEPSNLRTF
jgi:hypothetical protein